MHRGTVSLLGKEFRYENRANLHGMFKEVFIKKNYLFEQTDQPITIIDCGSNIGVSLLYFRLMAPQAHLIAFEPNPHTFSILSENVRKNQLNVQLHNVGLSADAGAAILYTDAADLSSQSASLTKHLETKHKNLLKVEIKTERLSQYIHDTVDILKLDIEGAEGEVLEDLSQNDKLKYIRKIFIEYHNDGTHTVYPLGSLLKTLEEAGFLYAIESGVKFPFKIPVTPRNYSYKIIAWK